ncbi:hypothetical protein CSOJ01_08843 [Colletotrichum sojae]|uniref:DUF6546 domain-containing protein n=1 Tax=Colletotrichum sojae TaxID=2175907 RepID=A0A8H6J5E0_9PEZI|nr:hypothetical protein CSOJ01_08843 [Colletotrichum sojae]
MSKRLESIKYMFRERSLKDASMNNEKWDFVPPSVKELSICNLDESGNPPRADLILPQSLRNVAVQLKTLNVSKFVDAAFLLPALPLNRHIFWPRLRALTLTMYSLCGEGHGDPSAQLALIAEAALQMPKLKKMELWSAPREGGDSAAGYFRYEVEGKKGRARGYATWRTGWGYQPPYWVLVKWDAVARSHTRGFPLEFMWISTPPLDLTEGPLEIEPTVDVAIGSRTSEYQVPLFLEDFAYPLPPLRQAINAPNAPRDSTRLDSHSRGPTVQLDDSPLLPGGLQNLHSTAQRSTQHATDRRTSPVHSLPAP